MVVFLCVFLLSFLFSPHGMISFFGLPIVSIFYFWRGEYKNIFILWSLFFFLWYIIFVALMIGFDGPLIFDAANIGGVCEPGVGYSEPTELLRYLFVYEDTIYFYFVFNSYFLLVGLSAAIGYPVYVPSIFNLIFAIIEFIAGIFGGGG